MSFTRDFVGTLVVPCLDQTTFDGSCGGSGTNTFTGKIVDRLASGYPRFNAAQPVAIGQHDIGTSTGLTKYSSLTVKIQHSNTTSTSATGATGWNDLTTSYQSCEQALFNITSPSSSAGGYESTAAVSTSTGQATGASAPSWYPLDQANQFLRIVVTPRIEASSSGGGALTLSGQLIFGEPQYAGVGSPVQSVNLGGGIQATTSTGALLKSTS